MMLVVIAGSVIAVMFSWEGGGRRRYVQGHLVVRQEDSHQPDQSHGLNIH